MTPEPPRPATHDAGYFDDWYAGLLASPIRNAIVARTLGLPPGMLSSGSMTWPGVAELTEALRLPRGGLLVDAACGFGSYGVEIARRSDARLLGVDFSRVALEQARAGGAAFLPIGRAEFRTAAMTATGIPDGTVDGLMCLDSVQFGPPPAALREFRRVLASGARVVLTGWEAVDASDERVSARIRAMDLGRDLAQAGFTGVLLQDRPEWREAEHRMWQELVAVPADEDDAGMRSQQAEGTRSLANWDTLRRVFAAATAP